MGSCNERFAVIYEPEAADLVATSDEPDVGVEPEATLFDDAIEDGQPEITTSALPADRELSKGMLSSDSSESSFIEQDLTLPMQDTQDRYSQGEVIKMSEDAMNSHRITELTVTGNESENEEDQELMLRVNIVRGID